MAMVLVITILAALLGIAAIGLSLQLDSTRSAGLIRDSRTSLFCAEAGLAAARETLITNYPEWNDVLNGVPVTWYDATLRPDGLPYGITGDADGDNLAPNQDFSVTFTDDGEDDGDTTVDNNQTIIVTSTCLLYPKTPTQVIEVLSLLAGAGCAYRDQAGQGCGNLNNAN
jgi:Tfp pilus assembly protein PilX